jgi:hypothetical protein
MKSEVDPRVRGPLLAIIGCSTVGMHYDLDEVFEFSSRWHVAQIWICKGELC